MTHVGQIKELTHHINTTSDMIRESLKREIIVDGNRLVHMFLQK